MPTLLQEKKGNKKKKTEVKETTDVKKQIDLLVERAKRAQEKFMSYTQEQINEIVKAMALAGIEKHVELAKLAHEETKMGVYEDKITKNLFAVEYVYNYIKDKKNCRHPQRKLRRKLYGSGRTCRSYSRRNTCHKPDFYNNVQMPHCYQNKKSNNFQLPPKSIKM